MELGRHRISNRVLDNNWCKKCILRAVSCRILQDLLCVSQISEQYAVWPPRLLFLNWVTPASCGSLSNTTTSYVLALTTGWTAARFRNPLGFLCRDATVAYHVFNLQTWCNGNPSWSLHVATKGNLGSQYYNAIIWYVNIHNRVSIMLMHVTISTSIPH